MRQTIAVLLVPVVFVAVAPALAAPVPTHLMKRSACYFPTTVGTKWIYEEDGREETLVITQVEDANGVKVVTVAKAIGEISIPEEKMAVSATGLARVECFGCKFDPPLVMLKTPFKSGNKWKSEPNRTEENAAIVGVEKVKVPAGTFEAVRVDAKYATMEQKEPASFWYAPNVGLVKRTYEGSEQVLKAFAPGKE